MANIFVVPGDITRTVAVEAIVTLINPGGLWFGGVDGAINRIAGNHYHSQARAILNSTGLSDGDSILAHGNRTVHNGNFDHVIFVVDNLVRPLNELVYIALERAYTEGISSVALPLMRSGVMLGAYEPDVKAVVQQMRLGIDLFVNSYDTNISIYVVVYAEPQAVKMLSDTMTLLEDA